MPAKPRGKVTAWSPFHKTMVKHGVRSGLEKKAQDYLKAQGVKFEYEKWLVPFVKPEQNCKYKPDFKLLDNGIIIETKGRFLSSDRKKHLLIKEQHEDLEIRFVFSRANDRLSKQSKTTYAMWAEQHGFKWADKQIPESWLTEVLPTRCLKALSVLLPVKGKKNV